MKLVCHFKDFTLKLDIGWRFLVWFFKKHSHMLKHCKPFMRKERVRSQSSLGFVGSEVYDPQYSGESGKEAGLGDRWECRQCSCSLESRWVSWKFRTHSSLEGKNSNAQRLRSPLESTQPLGRISKPPVLLDSVSKIWHTFLQASISWFWPSTSVFTLIL